MKMLKKHEKIVKVHNRWVDWQEYTKLLLQMLKKKKESKYAHLHVEILSCIDHFTSLRV